MTDKQAESDSIRAEHLIEALPYILEYRGATVVIKFGGHAMLSEDLKNNFAKDITLLRLIGIKPVVVHGGGPDINELLGKLHIESKFVNGLRYTDAKTMEVVEMVLGGKIGKDLSNRISLAGGSAISLSGKDSRLIEARRSSDPPQKDGDGDGDGNENGNEDGNGDVDKKEDGPSSLKRGEDIGQVGIPVKVNTHLIEKLTDAGYIPVIAPVGTDKKGLTYNINADTAASAVAVHMKARKLVLLTDVAGVLDEKGELILSLTPEKLSELRANNLISGGMIPKIECCLTALAGGCDAASIIDGRTPHSLLLEIFTHRGCGTEIKV